MQSSCWLLPDVSADKQTMLHMDGVLIQPPAVSSIPRLRTMAQGTFSYGSHIPYHNANLKILWDLSPRWAPLSADTTAWSSLPIRHLSEVVCINILMVE